MSVECRPPWHILRSKGGELTWFRWLTPFATHKYHYRIGPVPSDEHTVRFYGFGPNDQPLTCAGCGRVIDRDP